MSMLKPIVCMRRIYKQGTHSANFHMSYNHHNTFSQWTSSEKIKLCKRRNGTLVVVISCHGGVRTLVHKCSHSF